MFLLNSCLSLFTAACVRRHPFSRSYGAILPSSLTMLLPSALGFSPHPPVSVYGTGTLYTIAAFLGTQLACFATWISLRVYLLDCKAGLLTLLLLVLHRSLLSRLMLSACVPTFLIQRSTGISTCCPSATPFGLVLGPDLPRADQLYPGNLGYSAGRILTFLSLLIPAFSLHISPRLFSVPLRSYVNAPLPLIQSMNPKLRCRV